MMALIAVMTTTAAAVATVLATAAEERVLAEEGWVGCCQLVVARKLQKPCGDFTQL